MHVLFVHRNFPAQFGHIAEFLAERHGFRCTFISERPESEAAGVRRIQYKTRGGARRETHHCSRSFENFVWHSHAVYETLKAHPEVKPDLVVGHSGFGSTLCLRDLYDCPIVNFFEWYYHVGEAEDSFRQEFPRDALFGPRARARNAMFLADLENCTLGYSPTNWQRSQFPNTYQHKLSTIFDGIDTRLWRRLPRTEGTRWIGPRGIPKGMKIVTYVSRGFESMRGFDIFMKFARRLADRRKDVLFVCVGSDRICYGGDERYIRTKTFRQHVLRQDYYDRRRFLFLGQVPPARLVEILNLSDLHVYLTVPFILSWSLMDSLACGCTVLASDTEPLREVIDHGRNGLLAPFYDVDSFVDQACAVLDDPQAYRVLGEAAIERIERQYSLEAVMPQMLDLYDAALAIHRQENAALSASIEPTVISTDERRGLDALRAEWAWPEERPVDGEDADAEVDPCCDEPAIAAVVGDAPQCVVELGAWIGRNTRRLARGGERTVIAIEQWHTQDPASARPCWKPLVDDAYLKFVLRCWDERGAIIPLSLPLHAALEEIHRRGVRPDLIYVNARQIEDLPRCLRVVRSLFPNAALAGEDWQWPKVRQLVARLVEEDFCELEATGDFWKVWKDEGLEGLASEGATEAETSLR
jgi:glycosyltransferase involved in cell wall biosynthesis